MKREAQRKTLRWRTSRGCVHKHKNVQSLKNNIFYYNSRARAGYFLVSRNLGLIKKTDRDRRVEGQTRTSTLYFY